MRIHPPDPPQRLAPFILMSLLMHIALLYVIRPPKTNLSVPQPNPMEIYFAASAILEPARILDIASTEKRDTPVKPPASSMKHTAGPTAQPDMSTPPVFSPQRLMESAKSMARDEARKVEQQFAAQEKKKLDSPIGLLAQHLRQPHDEIRLANGMLKIVTDAGEICFQPAPTFAREMPGLYGIPMTCP